MTKDQAYAYLQENLSAESRVIKCGWCNKNVNYLILMTRRSINSFFLFEYYEAPGLPLQKAFELFKTKNNDDMMFL